tara:strand:- start:473 stop:625 length:153 start_codon:yes stop_codon:yes gene_type:complete
MAIVKKKARRDGSAIPRGPWGTNPTPGSIHRPAFRLSAHQGIRLLLETPG